MAKKSFFEKMGLVEKVDDGLEKELYEEDYPEEGTTLPEVNTDGVSQDNLIGDVYSANGLTDMSKSIFKAEEIKATLPPTMTTEAMKTTVTGILSSFGLTVEGLVEDAETRTTILQAACAQITEDNTATINERKAQIEDAKKLIEGWEQDIAAHEKTIANSVELINAEVKRIANLNTFLGGK